MEMLLPGRVMFAEREYDAFIVGTAELLDFPRFVLVPRLGEQPFHLFFVKATRGTKLLGAVYIQDLPNDGFGSVQRIAKLQISLPCRMMDIVATTHLTSSQLLLMHMWLQTIHQFTWYVACTLPTSSTRALSLPMSSQDAFLSSTPLCRDSFWKTFSAKALWTTILLFEHVLHAVLT